MNIDTLSDIFADLKDGISSVCVLLRFNVDYLKKYKKKKTNINMKKNQR